MNKKYFASVFLFAAAGVTLAGCPSSSSTNDAGASPAASAASPAASAASPAASGGTASASPDAGGGASPAASPAAAGAISVPGGAVGKDDKITIAFITNNPSDYWTIARKGTEKAQKELPNTTVDFQIPPTGAAAEQKGIIDTLLSKGEKGMAISPVDPANQITLLNDTAKKAIVFTQDSDAPTSDRMCYVGTDNHAAGVMAGEAMKKALPNGGDIMLFVGKKDAQNAEDRIAGIRDALKGTKINILDVRTDDADHARAKSNAADTLVKYPNLAGMMGIWSYNGPGILGAVKAAGKVGKVKIVCFDEEADTLGGVKDGSIEGTVVQQPFEFGYEAIKMIDSVARGDTSVIPASHIKNIPTKLIQKDNLDEFQATLAKERAGNG